MLFDFFDYQQSAVFYRFAEEEKMDIKGLLDQLDRRALNDFCRVRRYGRLDAILIAINEQLGIVIIRQDIGACVSLSGRSHVQTNCCGLLNT